MSWENSHTSLLLVAEEHADVTAEQVWQRLWERKLFDTCPDERRTRQMPSTVTLNRKAATPSNHNDTELDEHHEAESGEEKGDYAWLWEADTAPQETTELDLAIRELAGRTRNYPLPGEDDRAPMPPWRVHSLKLTSRAMDLFKKLVPTLSHGLGKHVDTDRLPTLDRNRTSIRAHIYPLGVVILEFQLTWDPTEIANTKSCEESSANAHGSTVTTGTDASSLMDLANALSSIRHARAGDENPEKPRYRTWHFDDDPLNAASHIKPLTKLSEKLVSLDAQIENSEETGSSEEELADIRKQRESLAAKLKELENRFQPRFVDSEIEGIGWRPNQSSSEDEENTVNRRFLRDWAIHATLSPPMRRACGEKYFLDAKMAAEESAKRLSQESEGHGSRAAQPRQFQPDKLVLAADLASIGDWLLAENEHDTRPPARVLPGRYAQPVTTIITKTFVHRVHDPSRLALHFHLRRAADQSYVPPDDAGTYDVELTPRANRYIGISREAVVCITPPVSESDSAFDESNWINRFTGIYTWLLMLAIAERRVLARLSHQLSHAVQRAVAEDASDKAREALERQLLQHVSYTLSMVSEDCGGGSEYAEFFAAVRQSQGTSAALSEQREETREAADLVRTLHERRTAAFEKKQAEALRNAAKAREDEKEEAASRRKDEAEAAAERERKAREERETDALHVARKESIANARDRRFQLVVSVVGIAGVTFGVVSGLMGMNLPMVKGDPRLWMRLDFWYLVGTAVLLTLTGLAIFAGSYRYLNAKSELDHDDP